jgi:predicted acylesterase/phospholipase RssA
MPYEILDRDAHLKNDGRPKRILALDGGGLRGVLTLGVLARMEALLAERHGSRPGEFKLCHYFDLIAGTSTGAIIAAALAQGMTVQQVVDEYMQLGRKVFQRSFFRQGVLRAKYDHALLSQELQRVYGAQTLLGGPELLTGLLVVTKRLDSSSAWPIANNPRGRYFEGDAAQGRVANHDFPLWKVVRASTAAPSFFDPESLDIATPQNGKPVRGNFVDGGVSPFNNPALQALMYATLDGYRVGWPTGADKLLVVSVGTGAADPAVASPSLAAENAIKSLLSLMQDCADLQQTLLQWMSASPTARVIDREIGDLQHDLIGGRPLISYLRYDVDLRAAAVQALDPTLTDAKAIASLSEMDAPDNMELLHRLGTLASQRDMQPADFPSAFDLPPVRGAATRKRYRRRSDATVAAVQLRLDTEGFSFRKWDAEQRCKAGDWIVDNGGDVYTVDADTFAATYQATEPGIYVKVGRVWAEPALAAGSVQTKGGYTHYEAGDYLVSNNEDGSDAYAIGATKFEKLYEPDE